ncbi:hypothetical protein [Anabaena azotica]|uniref:Uncharacterized protein n=1 Tax=Anabaena azotica FACHB-119 TaxID=947527 RepID=A0ABR8D6F2_9NOST|nr:hypothetical protein [Anabaena azotica]MBD2501726.1 hypothetical protein [Anabaena azotica FACHB-119]
MYLTKINPLYMGLLTILCVCTFGTVKQISLILSPSFSAVSSNSFQATSIPWITNQSECEYSGRNWHDNQCWDEEHNPMF